MAELNKQFIELYITKNLQGPVTRDGDLMYYARLYITKNLQGPVT